MKQCFLVALLCALLGPLVQAQTFNGQVIDAKTGLSVPNIPIYVQDSSATAPAISSATTSAGVYSFSWPGTPVLGTKFRIWTAPACGLVPTITVQYTGTNPMTNNIVVCLGAVNYRLEGTIRLNGALSNGPAMIEVIGVGLDTAGIDTVVTFRDAFQTNAGTPSAFLRIYPNIPANRLFLKATLMPGHPAYGSYLPTYHSTFQSWHTATPLSAYSYIGGQTDVNMIPTSPTSGAGCIRGQARAGGTPVSGRIILLTTGSNAAVNFTYTDAQGRFAFNNLALGTYKIHGDVVPKLNPALTMTLTGTKPCVENLLFDETARTFSARLEALGVSTATGTLLDELLPTPNPVNSELRIDGAGRIDGGKQLSVRDLSGRLIRSLSFSNGEAVRIDAASWPAGMYFIQLQTTAGTRSYRITKQ